MFEPMINRGDGLVLPVLESAFMVTSVNDVEPRHVPKELNDSAAKPSKLPSLYIPRQPIYNSKWRAGRILSWIIPPLLGLFILYGWQFASCFIIPYVCVTSSTLICGTYSVVFHTLLTLTLGLFIFLWIAPNHHSAPPSALPRLVQENLIPHQTISAERGYNECWQDSCRGRILPPRARHCKDCRKCRLEFDHHCPWLGCISRDTMKSFILFLFFATTAIIVGLAPVCSLAWKQIKFVTGLLWEDEWMYREWWNSKWSWIGGPVTRYIGAVAISYLLYDPSASSKLETFPTGNTPISITLLFYCFYGTILGIFCSVLCIGVLRDVARASSTIEATRTSRQNSAGVRHLYSYRYIQMPELANSYSNQKQAPKVQEIPATINLYDFGVFENLKRVFGRTPREWISPWPPFVDPAKHWQLGPRALAYLEMPTDQTQTDRKVD